MQPDDVDEWGITAGYYDVAGDWHPTPDEARDALRAAMGDPEPSPPRWFVDAGSAEPLMGPCVLVLEDGTDLGLVEALPPDLPLGHHHLLPDDGGPETDLVVVPASCPPADRSWGVAAQVYALWSAGSWGIGDLDDVQSLAARLKQAGAGSLALSPLHAPALASPIEPSPYFASSRIWLNPLHLPVGGTPPAPLRADGSRLVDRDAVWRAKRPALWQHFVLERDRPAWRRWSEEQGDGLERFARWSALAEELGPRWRDWPDWCRRPDSPIFEEALASDPTRLENVAFHRWLQWRMRRRLDEVSGAGVGLIGDLAVGFSPDGADAWAYQDDLALEVRIGAPPDAFNRAGQDWGLPPFVPWRLRLGGYAPIIATLRACLQGMAGLRIDHVMGLFRQYWIPPGGSPRDGAFVRMPAEDLLALVRLEAARAGAFVIGEDLGTVEDAVREVLADRGLLGTKVVWFEDDPLGAMPEQTLATVTTHDLPTIAGVWSGADSEPVFRERLQAAVGLPDGSPVSDVTRAAHWALLRGSSALRLLTTDDLAGTGLRPNRPGTVEPRNWSLPLPVPVDRLPLPAPLPAPTADARVG